MFSYVATRLLVLSATHEEHTSGDYALDELFDVVIQGGNIAQHSKFVDFRDELKMLPGIKEPPKLDIAGKHDLRPNFGAFKTKIDEVTHINGDQLER